MSHVTKPGQEPESHSRGHTREIEGLLDLLVEIALTHPLVDENQPSTSIKSGENNENSNLRALLK